MIARASALVLLLYALGFMLFAFTLGKPAPASAGKADAAVVLTGGPGRIEHAVAVLRSGQVKRVLVAGADPLVTKDDIARRLGGNRKLLDCCVDLGSESVDTRSNAEEAGRWLAKNRFKSVRLITSDWHMRRAVFELRHAMPRGVSIVEDAVPTHPTMRTLFIEYQSRDS